MTNTIPKVYALYNKNRRIAITPTLYLSVQLIVLSTYLECTSVLLVWRCHPVIQFECVFVFVS